MRSPFLWFPAVAKSASQNVLGITGANTECQCTERTMSTVWRIAAHDRHAGCGQSEFRSDNKHDATEARSFRPKTVTPNSWRCASAFPSAWRKSDRHESDLLSVSDHCRYVSDVPGDCEAQGQMAVDLLLMDEMQVDI